MQLSIFKVSRYEFSRQGICYINAICVFYKFLAKLFVVIMSKNSIES